MHFDLAMANLVLFSGFVHFSHSAVFSQKLVLELFDCIFLFVGFLIIIYLLTHSDQAFIKKYIHSYGVAIILRLSAKFTLLVDGTYRIYVQNWEPGKAYRLCFYNTRKAALRRLWRLT